MIWIFLLTVQYVSSSTKFLTSDLLELKSIIVRQNDVFEKLEATIKEQETLIQHQREELDSSAARLSSLETKDGQCDRKLDSMHEQLLRVQFDLKSGNMKRFVGNVGQDNTSNV